MYFYLLGIIQEFLVIINLYNGDLHTHFLKEILNEDIEYSIVDVIILILLFFYNRKTDIHDWLFNILCLVAHFQWYFHNPFTDWPTWWISSKPDNDIRHRSEYYDTHVMCFCIRFVLYITDFRKQFKKLL